MVIGLAILWPSATRDHARPAARVRRTCASSRSTRSTTAGSASSTCMRNLGLVRLARPGEQFVRLGPRLLVDQHSAHAVPAPVVRHLARARALDPGVATRAQRVRRRGRRGRRPDDGPTDGRHRAEPGPGLTARRALPLSERAARRARRRHARRAPRGSSSRSSARTVPGSRRSRVCSRAGARRPPVQLTRPGAVGLGRPGGTAIVSQRPEAQVLGVRVRDDVVWGMPHPGTRRRRRRTSIESGSASSSSGRRRRCRAASCSGSRSRPRSRANRSC